MDKPRQDILLETGTNEVEIAEFLLGSQSFGINVAKIKEFVPYDITSLTKVPNSPPSMIGVFLLRGRTIPLIDLNVHLGRKEGYTSERPVVLVTEFNTMINGFRIDAINQIHRLSWNDLKPLNPLLKKHTTRFTGTVNVKNHEILILDLEYIVSEIFPEKMKGLIEFNRPDITEEDIVKKRQTKKIVIAEDSNMIRKMIINNISVSGYDNITSFDNGLDAYNYIKKSKKQADSEGKDISEYINLVVSDIEMPKMDGLALCRGVKEELKLSNLHVIMFSSLINEQMAIKCRSVGSSAHVTKPQVGELVSIVDGLIL